MCLKKIEERSRPLEEAAPKFKFTKTNSLSLQRLQIYLNKEFSNANQRSQWPDMEDHDSILNFLNERLKSITVSNAMDFLKIGSESFNYLCYALMKDKEYDIILEKETRNQSPDARQIVNEERLTREDRNSIDIDRPEGADSEELTNGRHTRGRQPHRASKNTSLPDWAKGKTYVYYPDYLLEDDEQLNFEAVAKNCEEVLGFVFKDRQANRSKILDHVRDELNNFNLQQTLSFQKVGCEKFWNFIEEVFKKKLDFNGGDQYVRQRYKNMRKELGKGRPEGIEWCRNKVGYRRDETDGVGDNYTFSVDDCTEENRLNHSGQGDVFGVVKTGHGTGKRLKCVIKRRKILDESDPGYRFNFDEIIFMKNLGVNYRAEPITYWTWEDHLYMVFYRNTMSLRQFDKIVRKNKMTWPESCLHFIAKGVLHPLAGDWKKYRLVYGDLKPDNILLNYTNNYFYVQICDFGISRVLHPKDDDIDLPGAGTSLYVPPEVLIFKDLSVEEFQVVDSYLTNGSSTSYHTACVTSETKTTKNFGQLLFDEADKADVWGLGILIHQLAAGEHPFKLHGDCLTKPSPVLSDEVLENGSYSSGLVNFLKGCLGKLKKNNRPDRWNWEQTVRELDRWSGILRRNSYINTDDSLSNTDDNSLSNTDSFRSHPFDEFYEKVMNAEFSTPGERKHRNYRIFPITSSGYEMPILLATANRSTKNFNQGDQIKLIDYKHDDDIIGLVIKNESSTDRSEEKLISKFNIDHVTINTPARVIKDFYCKAENVRYRSQFQIDYDYAHIIMNNDMNMIYDERVVIIGIHGYRFKCRKENGLVGLVPKHVLLVEEE